jgi:hypothetical protein
MRFGVGFCQSTGSRLQQFGPSVLRRPAGQLLTSGSLRLFVAGVLAVFARASAVFQYALALSLLFASVARRTLTSFVAASAWAARPGASGSPAGSSEQFFGELRAAGVFGLLRALLAQVSAFGFSVIRLPALPPVSGLVRAGRHRQNRVAMVGANPSFNRTRSGVPAPGFISFSPGFVSLSQAG